MGQYEKCMKEEKGRKGLCATGYCTAKAKFDKYPSAYANGYAQQVCKGNKPAYDKDTGGKKSNKSSKSSKGGGTEEKSGDGNDGLRRWFREKWVDVCKKDENGNHPPCGRKSADSSSSSRKYPYCRPSKRESGTIKTKTAKEMTEAEKKRACRQKRSSAKKNSV